MLKRTKTDAYDDSRLERLDPKGCLPLGRKSHPSYRTSAGAHHDLFAAHLDLDLDQYVANHPFTGMGATVGGAQFADTTGSWLLPEPI